MTKINKKKGKIKMQDGGVASKSKKVGKLVGNSSDDLTNYLANTPSRVLKAVDDRIQEAFPKRTGKGSTYSKVKPYLAGALSGPYALSSLVKSTMKTNEKASKEKKKGGVVKAKSTYKKGGTVKKTKSKK